MSNRSPNTVAFVERFKKTLIVFGERHLNHLVSVFIDYYHRLRPHQAKENELLVPESLSKKRPRQKQQTPPEPASIPLSEISCETRLGGLLKHYYRRAA